MTGEVASLTGGGTKAQALAPSPSTPERKRPATSVVITESPSFQDRLRMFGGARAMAAAATTTAATSATSATAKPATIATGNNSKPPRSHQSTPQASQFSRRATPPPSRRLDPPATSSPVHMVTPETKKMSGLPQYAQEPDATPLSSEINSSRNNKNNNHLNRPPSIPLAPPPPPDLSQPRQSPPSTQPPLGGASSSFRQFRSTGSERMSSSPRPGTGPAAIQARLRGQRRQQSPNSFDEAKQHRFVSPEPKRDPVGSIGTSATASPFQPYNSSNANNNKAVAMKPSPLQNHRPNGLSTDRRVDPPVKGVELPPLNKRSSPTEERTSPAAAIKNGRNHVSPLPHQRNRNLRSPHEANNKQSSPPPILEVRSSTASPRMHNSSPILSQSQGRSQIAGRPVRPPSASPPLPKKQQPQQQERLSTPVQKDQRHKTAESPTSPALEGGYESFSKLRSQFSPRPARGQQPKSSKTALRQQTPTPPKQRQDEHLLENMQPAATIVKVLQSGETSPEQQRMAVEYLPVSPIAVHDVEPTRIPNSHVDVIRRVFGAECDLYRDVLLVDSKNASDRQIRVAYFRRGRELLMSSKDRRKKFTGLTVDAKAKFHAVTLAYEIATKPDWRKSYNVFGWDQEQSPLLPQDIPAIPARPKAREQDVMSMDMSAKTAAVKDRPAYESILRPALRSKGLKRANSSPGRAIRWSEEVEELVYRRDPDEDREKNEAARASRQSRKDFEQEALQSLKELDELQEKQETSGTSKRKKKKVLIDVTQQMKDMERRAFKNTFLDMVLNDIDTSLDGIEASIEGNMSVSGASDSGVDGVDDMSEHSSQPPDLKLPIRPSTTDDVSEHSSQPPDLKLPVRPSTTDDVSEHSSQPPDLRLPVGSSTTDSDSRTTNGSYPRQRNEHTKHDTQSDDDVASDLLSSLTKPTSNVGGRIKRDNDTRDRTGEMPSLSPRPRARSLPPSDRRASSPSSSQGSSAKRSDRMQHILNTPSGNSLPQSIQARRDGKGPQKVKDAFDSFAEASSRRDDTDAGSPFSKKVDKKNARVSDRLQHILKTKRGSSLPPTSRTRQDGSSKTRKDKDAVASSSFRQGQKLVKDSAKNDGDYSVSTGTDIGASQAETEAGSDLTFNSAKLNQCGPCAAPVGLPSPAPRRSGSDVNTIDEDFHSIPSNEVVGKNSCGFNSADVASDDDADNDFFSDLVIYLGRVSTDLSFGANRVMQDTQQIISDTFLLPEDNVDQVLEAVGMGMKDERQKEFQMMARSETY